MQAPRGAAVREVVNWELHDMKEYAADGSTTTLTFFLNPTQTNPLWSNMHASGQLTDPQSMDIYGIAVEIFPSDDQGAAAGIYDIWAAEKKKIRETALFEFVIGSKPYLVEPLIRIPEGMGFTGAASGADAGGPNLLILTHGQQNVKHFYPVGVPIKGVLDPLTIPSNQAFYVRITWPEGSVDINDTGRSSLTVSIRVLLIGHLKREVQ